MSADKHLSALDSTFLELEQADSSAYMHIGSLMVFEGAPPSRAEVVALLEQRLGALPHPDERLSHPHVNGLRFPAWERDPDFSVDRHVARAALPSPGSDEELLAWAGDFYSHRLDRRRPLWELVLLEGLDNGRWAFATKTHHCLVDG